VGVEVEQGKAVLEVELGGAILEVQHALLDGDVAGLEIEDRIEHGLGQALLGLRGVGTLVEPSA
jgi:hypothetical protein